MNHPTLVPLSERLARRLRPEADGCVVWTGYRRAGGYGQISRGGAAGGLVQTHRAAWELANGPIPDGLFVCHRCDNPPCCNVEHLFLGTVADNAADMVAKGRSARGGRLPQTKLTDEQVAEIRARYVMRCGPPKRGGRASNAAELAVEFGVSRSYVKQVVYGHYRTAVS